jgi:dephospho-CoA kinase
MILCLTGFPGSGKSTAARIFSESGFEVIEGSAAIREQMRKKGIRITAKSMEEFANRMKREKGKAVFGTMAAEKLKEVPDNRNVLVVGTRSVAEFEAVERAAGSRISIVVLAAPQEIRFKRLSERQRSPVKSVDTMQMRDQSNIGMGILELFERADFVISNTGTVAELRQSIRELLGKLDKQE